MKKKLLTAIVSIAILWFSFPTESLAAEFESSPEVTEESCEDGEAAENFEAAEELEQCENDSDPEESEDTNDLKEADILEETDESDNIDSSMQLDESEENASEEESTDSETETETIVETHSENHCTIIVSYTKEVYDDPFARLDTTELSLKSTYELVESQSADEFIQNIENDDIKMILSKVAFDDDFTNGYNISASIDVDNNVTIKSIKKTEKQEVVTEVEVEVTSTNESESLDEE